MGSSHKDPSVLHFSHPHPLECTTTSLSTANLTCFGCKLSITSCEDYYRCKTCAFSLHYACYKMPSVTHHPAHSKHDLVLVVIRSSPASSKDTLNCMACGKQVAGFCYHCAECNICFHTFCLALPLSITITFHPHKIKLEFSPPYDFFCDLCNKPSYNGWLYRCSMCEFDTHLACAVENVEPQTLQLPFFLQSNALLRQITSHQVDRVSFNGSIVHEIMRLVAQQIGGGNSRSTGHEDFDGEVVGWDKRLYSPRKKHNTSSGKRKIVELEETEQSPADSIVNLEERTPLRDKLTPLSDGTPQSCQYSDSCFSIDLAKSYPNHDRLTRVGKEVGSDHVTRSVMQGRIEINFGQTKEPFAPVNRHGFYSDNMAPQNTDFVESNQKVVIKNPNERLAKASNQTISNRDSKRHNHSCWRKFVSCCL